MNSEKQTNGLQLIRLLNEVGTAALRALFDAKCPPATLATLLHSRPIHATLATLLRRGLLNTSQWDKLYPAVGVPDPKSFDITLLYTLLRNICGLKPPKDPLWTSNPPTADRSDEANIARIRWYRNDVIHNFASGVDDMTFQTYWTEISSALQDLSIPQAELDALKISPLDDKKVMDILLEWKHEEKQLIDKVEDFQKLGQVTLDEIRGIKRQTSESQETVREVKKQVVKQNEVTLDEVRSIKRQVTEGQREVLEQVQHLAKKSKSDSQGQGVLKKLAKINFKLEMEFQAKKCHSGTREWLFTKVQNWLRDEESDARVMIMFGEAGIGKTVIAASVCQRMDNSGNLAGMHFCKFGEERYRNPRLMLQSFARSLCCVLPAYKEALADLLSHNLGEEQSLNKMSVKELFSFLLQEPLDSVPAPAEPLLFVIDALDEAEYHGRNQLMDVMSSYFARLPSWLKFLVTSRPEVNTVTKLQDLNPFEMKPRHEDNLKDIEVFLREKLTTLVPSNLLETLLSSVMEKSEGLMLYAYCTVEFLSKHDGKFTWADFVSYLPKGISVWYKQYVSRLQSELGITDEVFSRFLAALVSAREPLPVEIIPLLLRMEGTCTMPESAHGLDESIIKAIESISALLPLRDGRVHVFHKSFIDWLSTPQTQTVGTPRPRVTEKHGHQVLSQVYTQLLESIKNKEEVTSKFSPREVYALKHAVHHILAAAESDVKVASLDYLCDLEILFSRLCSDHCTVYDVIEECVDCQELRRVPPDVLMKIKEIEYILRRNTNLLQTTPQDVFQNVTNEAECDELVFEARELLRKKKYQTFLWFEVVNKDDRDKTSVVTELDIGSRIESFAVSPDGRMVVVYCRSGELSLWSLVSGKPVWKNRIHSGHSYNVSFNLNMHRHTCMFSPDGRLILYGQLDQVCSVDGTFEEFFEGCNRLYIKCQFSPDGKRLLALSPDGHLMLWDVVSHCLLVEIVEIVDSGKHVHDCSLSFCGKYIVSVSESEICLWDGSSGEKMNSCLLSASCFGKSTRLGRLMCPLFGKDVFVVSSQAFEDSERWVKTYRISTAGILELNGFSSTDSEQGSICTNLVFSNYGKYGAVLVEPSTSEESYEKAKEELRPWRIPMAVYSVKSAWFESHVELVSETSMLYQELRLSHSLKLIRSDTASRRLRQRCAVLSCAFSGDGSKIVTLDKTNKLSVYDISEERLKKKETTIEAEKVFVLPSGKIVAFGDSEIKVWNRDFKELLWSWQSEDPGLPLCATDEIVVFQDRTAGGVTCRDVETGNVKCQLKGHDSQVKHCCVDPHSSSILTTDEDTLVLWDSSSSSRWRKVCRQFGVYQITCLLLSSERKVVAIGSNINGLFIFDEMTGDTLKVLKLSVWWSGFVYGTALLVCLGSTGVLQVVDVGSLEKLGSTMCGAVVDIPSWPCAPLRSALSCSPCSRKIAIALQTGKVVLLQIHLPRH